MAFTKKTTWATLAISFLFLVSSNPINAQNKFKQHEEKYGVTISAKWKHAKAFDHDSPLALHLLIENKTDEAKQISFEVAFYQKGTKDFVKEVTIEALAAGKKIKGPKHDLAFVNDDITNQELFGDGFTWKIEKLVVAEVSKD